MSDPVVQATLKVVKVFWGLDANLAYRRHFPAINWLLSYSLYIDNLSDYLTKEIAEDWLEIRQQTMAILQKESELEEIVRLVGKDSLSPHDQLTLEIAKMIREDFLHQNAFHAQDTYTSLGKQYRLIKLIIVAEKELRQAVEDKIPLSRLLDLPVLAEMVKAKFIEEDKPEQFAALEEKLKEQVGQLK